MGTKVAATLNDELKPDFTVSTVAAASFVVADADLAIFIGDTFAGGKSEQVTGLRKCLQRIRENGSLSPLTTNESYAKTTNPALNLSILSGFNAVAVLPAETDVGVWYGPDYQQTSGASVTPGVLQLIDVYLEQVQKAA